MEDNRSSLSNVRDAEPPVTNRCHSAEQSSTDANPRNIATSGGSGMRAAAGGSNESPHGFLSTINPKFTAGSTTTTTPTDGPAVDILTFETYRGDCADQPLARSAWQRVPLKSRDAVIALTFFVAAWAARAPFIYHGETLLHSDEAIVGLMAQDIANGERFPIFFYGQRYMGSLEAYAVAGFSFVFDNPIHALRAGPALFFALLVAAQYLMLTRWFGRRGAVVGALALIASSPMFMQWSISARGGYIEVLLCGALLLWAYSEWFVDPRPQKNMGAGKFIFGALIGLGMWINPSIVLFLAPIILHAVFDRPLRALWEAEASGNRIEAFVRVARYATLPLVALAAVLLLNVTWATWVADGRVQKELLMGLFPTPVAGLIIMATLGGIAFWCNRRYQLIDKARAELPNVAPAIMGIIAGASPSMLYVVQRMASGQELEPSLPLGFRPIWMAGDTLMYFMNGLPLLFGPDARPFLSLVGVGRDTVTQPLDLMTSGFVFGASWLALGAAVTALIILWRSQSTGLSRLFRMLPTNHGPALLLMLGTAATIGLYLLGGCALDFTTIRYLVPIWVFIPGLLAAVFISRQSRVAARLAPCVLILAWGVGQLAMAQQLGARHPLGALSDELKARHVSVAVAEPLDAHLLSYLTQQQCKVVEFESFWPRLAHYFPLLEANAPMNYIVQTTELDREWDWINGGWPGASPPETKRFLWPRLRSAINRQPELLLDRTPLCDGYELIRLQRPLADRNIPATLAKPKPPSIPHPAVATRYQSAESTPTPAN